MNVTMGNMILFAVFLLLSCQMKGSTAVTPVFVQKGHDVLLEVKKDAPKKFLFISWNFNKKPVVTLPQNSKPEVNELFSKRLEFSVENYSVTLKNLQETDSGLYTAQVRETGDEQTLAEYNVTVQDPVSPVVLTVDSVSRSTNLCNLTVTCRTQDSHISSTFTCDNQTCSQEEGERSKVTASGASLQVYLVNDSIICNHSNQVSSTKNREQTKIWNLCPQHDGSSNGVIASGAVAGVVFAVVVAGLLFVWFKCKRPIEQKNKENTIYAVPEDIVPAQNRIQTPAEEVSTISTTSTYALVQFHTGHEKSQSTMNSTLPETVYAEVDRAVKSNARSLSPPNTENP
ncbi:CD48 antigen-like isoform X5 [Channa argus]|uniref:CD48 antigen-like isoform X5 n=1 Tax=Channa argus TaxID=215402 RepID=UPI0035205229